MLRDPPVPFWPVWKQGLWYVAQWYHELPANDQTFYMQQALSGAMRMTSPTAVAARMQRAKAACASSARASKKARVADEGGDGVSVKSAERMFIKQHRMAMKKELKEMRDEQKVLKKVAVDNLFRSSVGRLHNLRTSLIGSIEASGSMVIVG